MLLVAFAARMHEVQDPSDQADMMKALAEIRRFVTALVIGRVVSVPTDTQIGHVCGILAALLQHGPVWTEREHETLTQLAACVSDLLDGLAVSDDDSSGPPCSGLLPTGG